MRRFRLGHLLDHAVVLCLACTRPSTMPPNPGGETDWAPVLDDLLVFHRSTLRDSSRIDTCSIQEVTGDSRIVSRLSPQARNAVTPECVPGAGHVIGAHAGLLSVKRFPDSIVVAIEIVDGEYFHVASYKAVPVSTAPGFRFMEVTLHSFGHTVPAPPPPPPPKKN